LTIYRINARYGHLSVQYYGVVMLIHTHLNHSREEP